MGEGPSVKMSCRTPRSTTRQGQQTQRLCLWGAPCVLLSIQRDQGQAAGATCPHSCPLHGRIAATVGRRPHRPERSRGMLAGLILHQSQDWLNYFRKSDEEEQKRNCPFSVVCWFMEPRGGAGRPGVLRPRTSWGGRGLCRWPGGCTRLLSCSLPAALTLLSGWVPCYPGQLPQCLGGEPAQEELWLGQAGPVSPAQASVRLCLLGTGTQGGHRAGRPTVGLAWAVPADVWCRKWGHRAYG